MDRLCYPDHRTLAPSPQPSYSCQYRGWTAIDGHLCVTADEATIPLEQMFVTSTYPQHGADIW